MSQSKDHWEKVYQTKTPQEVSWTQEKPEISLAFVKKANLSKDAKIIDIGGGDSKLVDFLLAEGYQDLTVLDISPTSLERAKKRLGEKALKVKWIACDINDFEPTEKYDFWHDRAAYHFLTDKAHIDRYVQMVSEAVKQHLVIGTFSTNGPLKCSGLVISQYDEEKIDSLFKQSFRLSEVQEVTHTTPFNTTQEFIFSHFIKA